MFPTKNDLAEPTRAKICELLNERLADAVDLYSQCKQAHWLVRGPQFVSLHALFDQMGEDVEEYMDLIAERAMSLAGTVEGTVRQVAKRTSLVEYPSKAKTGADHLEALATALAAFGKGSRRAIAVAAEHRDDVTADLFTEITRGTDKWLWQVEAHSA